MKNLIPTLFFFLLFGASILHAQIYPNIPNQYFNTIEERPCPYDSTVSVTLPADWELYQTLNGEWDGPRDSSLCLTGYMDGSSYKINPDQINTEFPLFLRCLFTEENKILLSKDWVYELRGDAYLSSYSLFPGCDTSTFCSNLITGIQVPDESGDSTTMRIHKAPWDLNNYSGNYFFYCLPTEYFEENYLRELIFEYKVQDTIGTEEWIATSFIHMEPVYYIMPVEDFTVPSWSYNGASYDIYMTWLFGDYGTNLVMHETDSYPNAQNLTYVEATPEDNPGEQREINLYVEEYSSLEFQPFTSMRGSFIAGSDSLRHSLNIIFEGAEMCMSYIDVIFERNTKFVYKGGEIFFTNKNGCLMFHRGAALAIADNTTFHYGNNGIGVLALGPGGTIEFGDNSTLVINNRLVLSDFWQHPSNQVYMHLPKGASLIFGEHGKLTKQGLSPEEGHMKLNVYMEGGILDDSHLSETEKQLINRIYPEVGPKMADNVQILGNPAENNLQYSINLQDPTEVNWSIFDRNGKLVLRGTKHQEKGLHFEGINIHTLPRGIYFFEVSTVEGTITSRFIKI